MTALSTIQSFCYEMALNPVPSTLLAVTDQTVNQYLYTFYAIGRDLLQAKCWTQLKRTHTITTAASADDYPLPTDFYCSLYDTMWNTTQKWKMIGPMTDSNYNNFLYGYGVYTNQTYYRIFGRPDVDQLELQPVPPDGETIKFDYISNGWINNAGTYGQTVTSDAATFVFDEDLMILGMKWKWLQTKGLDYQAIQAEYLDKIGKAQARFKGDHRVLLSPSDYWAMWPNVPEGNFTM